MKRPDAFTFLIGFLFGLNLYYFLIYSRENTVDLVGYLNISHAKLPIGQNGLKCGIEEEANESKRAKDFASTSPLDQILAEKIENVFPVTERQKETIRSAISKLADEELRKADEIFDRLCRNDKNCDLQPPFVHLDSQYKVAKKYGLTACSIFKNMSTILMAIMCFLHEPQRILESKWTFFEQWDKRRACFAYNEAQTWQQVMGKLDRKMEEITKFALIREPMEKFMSGYTNQCLEANKCGGCQNLTCILEMLKTNSKDYRFKGIYGKSGHPRAHVNAHFLPQNWRCEFGTMLDEYVLIKYNSSDAESLVRDLGHLFEGVGVEETSIQYIRDKLNSGRSSHSTAGKKQREMERNFLEGNSQLMRKFLNLFFFDYLILGYPLPNPQTIRE